MCVEAVCVCVCRQRERDTQKCREVKMRDRKGMEEKTIEQNRKRRQREEGCCIHLLTLLRMDVFLARLRREERRKTSQIWRKRGEERRMERENTG